MLHEIYPHIFDNQFKKQEPKPNDFIIIFNGSKTLLKKDGEKFTIPQISDFFSDDDPNKKSLNEFHGHYLLSIDGTAYFLEDPKEDSNKVENISAEYFEFVGNRAFRNLEDITQRLGGATAAHIAHWESLNKYCGRCGTQTTYSTTERALICPNCKNTIYPRISPVVIVAVRNGDKLLMARNLDLPDKSHLFLISGFVEVGESLEQAVAREVEEEAGLKVKNIEYFSSQPWPFSDSLIAGFNAELDGDDKIHIQESEIETALWVSREDIPEYDTSVSISSALIENFRRKSY